MKRTFFIIFTLILSTSEPTLAWQTSSTIRTPDGYIINPGDTKAEAFLRLGPPAYRDVTSVGIDQAFGGGEMQETWTYIINDNIYTIRMNGDRVGRIEWKRYSR